MAFILTACPGSTSSLSVSQVTVSSDFKDAANKFYICDDKTTVVTVSFKYAGDLASWDAQFKGATTGTTTNKFSYTKGGGGFTEANNVITMTFNAPAKTAPLGVGGTASANHRQGIGPQAISVVPVPREIGKTDLILTIRNSAGQEASDKVTGLPVIENCASVSGDLSVSNVSFASDYNSKADGTGISYICNDSGAFTPVKAKFTYSGDLASWKIQFKGKTTGQLGTEQSFTYAGPNPPGGTYTESPLKTITVQYAIQAGTAPLSVQPQAIIVVPVPEVVGETAMILTVKNSAGVEATDTFGGIKVIKNCPLN